MKKLLISVLAISGLMACTKSDVVEMPQSQAIKFGSAFVDNSTKVVDNSSTTDNLNSFNVWGKLTPDGTTNTNIFSQELVTKGGTGIGTTWFYNDGSVQYWIPTVQYEFAAIAGLANNNYQSITANANGMPTDIVDYDISSQSDLMYDGPIAREGVASGNEEVKFNFNHLLSKVKFQFLNSFPQHSDLYITVENVQIVDAYKTADCALGNYTATPVTTSTWTGQTKNSFSHSFGNAVSSDNITENAIAAYITPNNKTVDATSSKTEVLSGVSNYSRLLIPGIYSKTGESNPLQISFIAKVWLKQGTGNTATFTEIKALRKNFTTIKSTDLGLAASETDALRYLTAANSTDGLEFKENHSYNLKITLGQTLEEIKFSINVVKDWTEGDGDPSGEVDTEIEIPLS